AGPSDVRQRGRLCLARGRETPMFRVEGQHELVPRPREVLVPDELELLAEPAVIGILDDLLKRLRGLPPRVRNGCQIHDPVFVIAQERRAVVRNRTDGGSIGGLVSALAPGRKVRREGDQRDDYEQWRASHERAP